MSLFFLIKRRQLREAADRDLIVLVMPRSGEGPCGPGSPLDGCGEHQTFPVMDRRSISPGLSSPGMTSGDLGLVYSWSERPPLQSPEVCADMQVEKENKWLYTEGLFSVFMTS